MESANYAIREINWNRMSFDSVSMCKSKQCQAERSESFICVFAIRFWSNCDKNKESQIHCKLLPLLKSCPHRRCRSRWFVAWDVQFRTHTHTTHVILVIRFFFTFLALTWKIYSLWRKTIVTKRFTSQRYNTFPSVWWASSHHKLSLDVYVWLSFLLLASSTCYFFMFIVFCRFVCSSCWTCWHRTFNFQVRNTKLFTSHAYTIYIYIPKTWKPCKNMLQLF